MVDRFLSDMLVKVSVDFLVANSLNLSKMKGAKELVRFVRPLEV
jgi:hypothetical protein